MRRKVTRRIRREPRNPTTTASLPKIPPSVPSSNRGVPREGEEVWVRYIGYEVDRMREGCIRGRVIEVNRKYFKFEKGTYSIKFSLEDWKEYAVPPNFIAYRSEEEYIEEREKHKLCMFLYDSFRCGMNYHGLTLTELKSIVEIIRNH